MTQTETDRFFRIAGTTLNDILDGMRDSHKLNPAAFAKIAETTCMIFAHDCHDVDLAIILIDRAARWESRIRGQSFPNAGEIFGKFCATANIAFLTDTEAGQRMIREYADDSHRWIKRIGRKHGLSNSDMLDLAIFAYLTGLAASHPQSDWADLINEAVNSIDHALTNSQDLVAAGV